MRQPYALILFLFSTAVCAGELNVTIDAGPHARSPAIIQFQALAGMENGLHRLSDDKGSYFVEVENNRATVVIPSLAANESRTLHYEGDAGTLKPDYGVWAKKDEGTGSVKFDINGQHVFTYNHEKTALPEKVEPHFARGGYIFPLFTGNNVQILDDYPPDHKHHHGIWAAWTKTKFEERTPDFWNMGGMLGTVEPVKLEKFWSGTVSAGYVAHTRYVDLKAPESKVVLNEVWDVRLYHTDNSVRIFDIHIKQDCAGNAPLTLPKYHYGGLGVRGHSQWNGKGDKTEFLTSEGKTRVDGNQTSGKWCAMSGKIDGKAATIAILCHPENFRFPQPMRLNPIEPFFCYAPQQGGEFAIEPGKPYNMKYRIAALDGPPDAKRIEQLWNDYATPAKVK